MSELKTHAEIIGEMRFHGQQNINAEKAKREYGILTYEGRLHKNFADDLAAAHERELDELRKRIGDPAKLREALKKCLLYIACAESVGIGTITLNDKVKLDPKKIIKSAKAALAAPPRNCDALTADERTHKFIEKWEKAHGESIDGKTII